MGWFGLDPESTLARLKASQARPRIRPLASSVVRGTLGVTVLSVAGFAPWAIGGHWLGAHVGEAGMYAVCAAVFIGLSGPLLEGLLVAPGSLGRFYLLFGTGFSFYSIAWIAGWMGLRHISGHLGSLAGLLAGTAIMGWIFARAFGEPGAATKAGVCLFVLNTAGYYAGGWAEGWIARLPHLSLAGLVVEKPRPAVIAMLMWGVFYGIGLGAGLGLAFHFCQSTLRKRLSA